MFYWGTRPLLEDPALLGVTAPGGVVNVSLGVATPFGVGLVLLGVATYFGIVLV